MTSTDIPNVREEVIPLLGWPTDTISIDFVNNTSNEVGTSQPECPHTFLVFIPGNPGCVGWYTPNLIELVTRLGHGYAARGVSYAGHSPDESMSNVEAYVQSEELDVTIPWTVDGQILHKSAFIDHALSEFRLLKKGVDKNIGDCLPRFIFLSHSIGAHMVERLCVLRPDILYRAVCVVHIMPFTRMKAYPWKQFVLDKGAGSPGVLIAAAKGIIHVLRVLPKPWVDKLTKLAFEDEVGRDLALKILRQPSFARNFFELGTEEIRDVPETLGASSLRLIAKHCPISILYCGNDHWAPEFFQADIKSLQSKNILPKNISLSYMPELRHDYVCYDHMVPKTVDWCFDSIQAAMKFPEPPRSRL